MAKDRCAVCDELPTVEIVCRLDSTWTCAAHEAEVTDICIEEGVHILDIKDRPQYGVRYRP